MLDYLIIGAGPAGLQLAHYLQKSGHSYRILEAGERVGNFFEKFPRHRKLISINKVYTGFDDPDINMRWDWNSLLSSDPRLLFKNYSRDYFPDADAMLRYLGDFAQFNDLQVELNTRVERVHRDEENFVLLDQSGKEWRCRRLIVATGLSRAFLPDTPGLDLAESYQDVSLDPEDFANQRVLIIGKGNSAFETADHLVATASTLHLVSPRSLNLAWNTHYVGHLRAVNNNLLDTYQLKSQNAILDAQIEQIKKVGDQYHVRMAYAHADGEVETLIYDRLIACTGFRFDSSIFDEDCSPEVAIDGRFPDQSSQWESVNVSDLFFAGTLTQMRDFKKSTSGFIHGFRYNVQALFHILQQRYHDVPWPCRLIAADPSSLMDAVIDRINRTGALWQQFGFLADLVVMDDKEGVARYYEEVPLDFFLDGGIGIFRKAFAITLDYGASTSGDPFNVERIERNDVDRANESRFLHPIVRCYERGREVATHHVIEDLESRWNEEAHKDPLREFLAEGIDLQPMGNLAFETQSSDGDHESTL